MGFINHYIKAIAINHNYEQKEFRNLSKINLFIGENNSGKSFFLRSLFKDSFFYIPNDIDLIREQLKKELNEFLQNSIEFSEFEHTDYLMSKLDNPWVDIKNEKNLFEDFFTSLTNISYGLNIPDEVYSFIEQFKRKNVKELKRNENEYSRLYIPVLRGLRSLGADDTYFIRTNKDYFSGKKNSEDIFTGFSLYEDIRNFKNSPYPNRKILKDYEKFLSAEFFNGKDVELTADKDSDVILIKIGEEQEKHIYDLGDGLQTIITITFPLFKRRGDKLLIFIEEPETNLHPGMQRTLMEILYKTPDFQGFQFFFTTHSNHFLDITLDFTQVSVYTFKKEYDDPNFFGEKQPRFIIENVTNENSSVLDMLGVKNSSVFLSNCTIWVEGITDRYYIKKYLELYQGSLEESEKRYKEDVHFSFVEYSGSNITHWSFLDEEDEVNTKTMNVERICSKLLLITDKDSDKKLPRQKKLEGKLGKRFICLDCKEVENLLSVEVLKRVINDYEGAEARFNRNISETDYKNKYIGKYIDDHLVQKKRKGKYGSESGTINDKVNFCEKALKHIHSVEDLSEEARKLVKRVYEFIKSKNE